MLHMTVWLWVTYAAFALAASCQTSYKSPRPGQITNHTICFGNIQRSYLLFLPKDYDLNQNSRPLILSYHGGTKDAENQSELDRFWDPYFNTYSIVVYPQGHKDTWQGVPDVNTDDVGFTNSLLDHLIQQYRIDHSRIYATGKSQGGGFAGFLACDPMASKRIAAFAPVSGAFYTKTSEDDCKPETVRIRCNPGRSSIPFLEFHGELDKTISYHGGPRRGVCLPTIAHYVTEWAIRNKLNPQNQTSRLDQDTVIYSFGNGLVRGYKNRLIGHDWPSTTENPDNTREGASVASYNATPIILEFFKQHRLM